MYHVWWVAGDITGHYVVKSKSADLALAEAQGQYRVKRIGQYNVVWYCEQLTEEEGILLEIVDWM